MLADLCFTVTVSNSDTSDSHNLTHVKSGDFVTHRNFSRYVASGNMYNSVALGCMEYCHDFFKSNYDLETVATTRGDIIASKCLSGFERALVVINGKGLVQPGILARSSLMKYSFEQGERRRSEERNDECDECEGCEEC
ncbi:hypothetical protein TL16_g00354 [Triparma laevis f. inornata]|uniref:Uncharacterized protein n=1 Tax=Triparma laevis f. inornata TaxID=1714386 RepID=A0A9W7DM59_9STRA|nr:hypothetical protein TL16_g00354 [Triparma laevis f. inornata]